MKKISEIWDMEIIYSKNEMHKESTLVTFDDGTHTIIQKEDLYKFIEKQELNYVEQIEQDEYLGTFEAGPEFSVVDNSYSINTEVYLEDNWVSVVDQYLTHKADEKSN